MTIGLIAGAYGGIYFDRRAGDAWGANMHAGEMATHLKVMSSVFLLLNKNDTPSAQKLLRLAIDSSRTVMESVARTVPSLTPSTVARVNEAIAFAEKAGSPPDIPIDGSRRE